MYLDKNWKTVIKMDRQASCMGQDTCYTYPNTHTYSHCSPPLTHYPKLTTLLFVFLPNYMEKYSHALLLLFWQSKKIMSSSHREYIIPGVSIFYLYLSVPTVAVCPNSIFWTGQQHPTQSSHWASVSASLPLPALRVLGKILGKGLQGSHQGWKPVYSYLNFPKKAFFCQRLKGKAWTRMWEQSPPWHIFLANMGICGFKAAQESIGWGWGSQPR